MENLEKHFSRWVPPLEGRPQDEIPLYPSQIDVEENFIWKSRIYLILRTVPINQPLPYCLLPLYKNVDSYYYVTWKWYWFRRWALCFTSCAISRCPSEKVRWRFKMDPSVFPTTRNIFQSSRPWFVRDRKRGILGESGMRFFLFRLSVGTRLR